MNIIISAIITNIRIAAVIRWTNKLSLCSDTTGSAFTIAINPQIFIISENTPPHKGLISIIISATTIAGAITIDLTDARQSAFLNVILFFAIRLNPKRRPASIMLNIAERKSVPKNTFTYVTPTEDPTISARFASELLASNTFQGSLQVQPGPKDIQSQA